MKNFILMSLLLCGALVPGSSPAATMVHSGDMPLEEIVCGVEGIVDSPPAVAVVKALPAHRSPRSAVSVPHCPLPTVAHPASLPPCDLMDMPEGCHCIKAAPPPLAAGDEKSGPSATLSPDASLTTGRPGRPPVATPLCRSLPLRTEPRPPSR
ncbi:MAG: hypothetical protein HQK87_05975 [Nitrospinae bacterium]|nr:hypothetical protein [Nitrospinota bacterium]